MTAHDLSQKEIQGYFAAVCGAVSIARLCIDKMDGMTDGLFRPGHRRMADDFHDLQVALETVRIQLGPVTQFLHDLCGTAERDG